MNNIFFVIGITGMFLMIIGAIGLNVVNNNISTDILKSHESYYDPVDTSDMPSDDELIESLNKAMNSAEKRQWRVFNTAYYKDDPDSWMAIADNGKGYIEDGAVNYWLIDDQKSMDAAMYKLLKALSSPPNWEPRSRDNRERRNYEGISGGIND